MAKTPKVNIDFAAMGDRVASQFRGLNPNDPSTWPAVPRYGLCLLLTILVVVGLWFAWLSTSDEELKASQAKELTLREDYKKKLVQAVNLDAEMDALLSDINQAGLGRSLLFDYFKPGAVSVKEYYAELPISLRVVGRYHDLGSFAADIANLSRIVTLNNLTVTPMKDGTLGMEAIARTYRYLDQEEVTAQRKATAPGAKK
jgi:type IV pilus assembly protein PilO